MPFYVNFSVSQQIRRCRARLAWRLFSFIFRHRQRFFLAEPPREILHFPFFPYFTTMLRHFSRFTCAILMYKEVKKMNISEKSTEIFHYTTSTAQKSILFLHPEQIQLFPSGKKSRGGENARIRMAESIRKYGVLQPFSVRIRQINGGFPCYQLIGEEDRFRAVCMAGVERIPCVVLSGEDRRCAELACLDEYQGKNMHFLDEAHLFDRLTRQFSMKQTEIAEKCGLSQSSVANKLRLLQLSDREQESIRRAGLGERHARAILRINDPKMRQEALESVILRHLSVVQTEELVETLVSGGAIEQSPARCAGNEYSASAREFARQKPHTGDFFRTPGQKYDNNTGFVPQAPAGNNGATGSATEWCINHASPASSEQKSMAYSPFGGTIPAVSSQTEPAISSFSGQRDGAGRRKETAAESAPVTRRVTSEIPAPAGILPRKFILHDLQPLYNSIERTLSIFRKTGMNAECSREEAEDAVHIYIKIPRKSAL